MLDGVAYLVNSWAMSWEKSQLATAAQSTIWVRIILSTSTEIIWNRAGSEKHIHVEREGRLKKNRQFLKRTWQVKHDTHRVSTWGWFRHTSYTTLRMCNFPSSLSVSTFRISWNLEGRTTTHVRPQPGGTNVQQRTGPT